MIRTLIHGGPVLPESGPGLRRPQPLPAGLLEHLVRLQLLDGLPFHYLVPEPAALPPESLRFFFVDRTFTDALIEGAMRAGSIGAQDEAVEDAVMDGLYGVKDQLEARLRALAGQPAPEHRVEPLERMTLTGLLLRSELVRLWPKLRVKAFQDGEARLGTLRIQRLAPDLLIAVFAGVPLRVELVEPYEGTRFGVERVGDSHYQLNPRRDDGAQLQMRGEAVLIDITDFIAPSRRVDVTGLGGALAGALARTSVGPSRLALCLQQTPFTQAFTAGGDTEPGGTP